MSFIHYMEQELGPAKYSLSGAEASWDCPFCTDRRKRFRMNRYKLLAWCFNCEWRGNAIAFVKDYKQTNWKNSLDIVNFYQEFQPLPNSIYEEVFEKILLEGDPDTRKNYIPLPSDFNLLSESKSIVSERFKKYLKRRNVTNKQIDTHGMGYCLEGIVELGQNKRTKLNNHVFIQSFDDDLKTPNYWMARTISDNVQPKVFNPVGGINTINKSDVVFNLNNAKKTGFAIITEGVFDSLTVGESGVCLFGKTLSINQLLLLIKADLESIYIMLDSDARGNAVKIANELQKHIGQVYLCDIRQGDPNEIGRKGCLQLIKDAEKYSNLTALKFKLNS